MDHIRRIFIGFIALALPMGLFVGIGNIFGVESMLILAFLLLCAGLVYLIGLALTG